MICEKFYGFLKSIMDALMFRGLGDPKDVFRIVAKLAESDVAVFRHTAMLAGKCNNLVNSDSEMSDFKLCFTF